MSDSEFPPPSVLEIPQPQNDCQQPNQPHQDINTSTDQAPPLSHSASPSLPPSCPVVPASAVDISKSSDFPPVQPSVASSHRSRSLAVPLDSAVQPLLYPRTRQSSSEILWQIDEISEKRVEADGNIKYLCRWKHFMTKTWEFKQNLRDCESLIQQCEERERDRERERNRGWNSYQNGGNSHGNKGKSKNRKGIGRYAAANANDLVDYSISCADSSSSTPSCGEEEYEVERLEDDRTDSKGSQWFLVKWKGYLQPTWEKAELLNCPVLLKQYCKRKEEQQAAPMQQSNEVRKNPQESSNVLAAVTSNGKKRKHSDSLSLLPLPLPLSRPQSDSLPLLSASLVTSAADSEVEAPPQEDKTRRINKKSGKSPKKLKVGKENTAAAAAAAATATETEHEIIEIMDSEDEQTDRPKQTRKSASSSPTKAPSSHHAVKGSPDVRRSSTGLSSPAHAHTHAPIPSRPSSSRPAVAADSDAADSRSGSGSGSDSGSGSESLEYVVESILDHCVRGGVNYYRIKWENYSDDQCTWEPERNIIPGAQQLLDQYCKRHGIKKRRGKDRDRDRN